MPESERERPILTPTPPDRPPRNVRRRLAAAFAATALVLLVGAVTTLSARRMLSAYSGVEQTTHTISELRDLSTSLLDAESSVRGYMIAGDERFLATYSDAVADAQRELSHVISDMRDDPRGRSDLVALTQAARDKLRTTAALLELARADRPNAGRRLLETESRAETDSVRAAVARLVTTETAQLANRTRQRTRNTRLTLGLIVGGAAIAFLLLMAVLAGLRRELIHETRLHQELVERTRQLDAARERQRLILESAESGIYGLDDNLRCTFINEAAARMLGYTTEELLGTTIHDVVHHSRVDGSPYPSSECPISIAALSGTRIRNDDEVYWRKDGTPLFVDYTAAPLSKNGGPAGAVVTFVDITQRKHDAEIRAFLADAVNALSSSLDYRTTLKQVAMLAVPRLGDWCAVDMLDENNVLRRLAIAHRDPEKIRQVERLTAHRPPRLDAPIGSGHVITTGTPDFYPDLPHEIVEASVGDDAEFLEFLRSLELRSLLAVPLVVRGSPIGAIVCVMSESRRRFTETDLHVATELAARAGIAIENAILYREAEEARERAERADEAKSQFLAAMSHELRTPLNAISGYAELIQIGVHGPVTDKQRESLERVQRSAKTLLALINDILNFSKLHAGFVDIHTSDIELAALLENIDDWVEPQLRAKEISYSYGGCPREIVVRGDRDKIQQVMLNLLSNAVKFSPPGASIDVSCEYERDYVRIAVRDTGPGIPRDKLEVIFEPFVQLDPEHGTKAHGTGLGLAISRDLARAMGGDLRAESEVGRGSTFIFTLPRAGTDARADGPDGDQRAGGRGSVSGASAAT